MMTDEDRLFSLLSLAMKAGALKCGGFNCEEAIKKRRAFLLITAVDMAPGTEKKFSDKCRTAGIDHLVFGTKERLAAAVGKEYTSCIAVCDRSFADGFKKKFRLLEDGIWQK